MDLPDAYYRPGTIDCYTFVCNEQDPRTGYYTMLATDNEGIMFSQWTEGVYDPNGRNEHLGQRVIFGYLGRRCSTGWRPSHNSSGFVRLSRKNCSTSSPLTSPYSHLFPSL